MKTKKDIHEENLELTPDILKSRIDKLEKDLADGKLEQDQMHLLLDLYTVIFIRLN